MRRRLFTGIATLAFEPGYRRPKNPGAPTQTEGDGAVVRIYGFARTVQDATRMFREALAAARYKTVALSNVRPNGSHKPWPLDEDYLCPADFRRARISGDTVFGRFTGYENDD
jgi:hypothetical protein